MTLAHNLAVRESAIKKCWPTATIYSLGDAAHLAEHSDHNQDSRGVVHAIDVMFAAGTSKAIATLAWALSDTTDLEYVIHNHKIYERSNGFKARAYTGSDPHTNHIHISGKHGSVGANSHTGNGYDLVAEQYAVHTTPCDKTTPPVPTPSKDEIMDVILPAEYGGDGKKTISAEQALSSLMRYVLETRDDVLKVKAELDVLKGAVDGLPKA